MTAQSGFYVFKGEDGSVGYRTGQRYFLTLLPEDGYPIVIERFGGGGRCPYASEAAFLRNWTPAPDTEGVK